MAKSYVTGEGSDLFDPDTGAYAGVLDLRGRETLIPTVQTDPITGMIGFSIKTSNRTSIFSTGVPLIVPSSGTIADNGALTLTTALPATYAGCFMFFPSGALFSGSAAGFRYVVMTTTTSGTIFSDTYVSGKPTYPTTPSPVVAVGPGAYTQLTSSIALCTFTLPASSLGKNGSLRVEKLGTCDSNATGRAIETKVAGNTIDTYSAAGQTSYRLACLMANANSESAQIGNNFTGFSLQAAGTLMRRTIDTTVDQVVTLTVTLGLATQFCTLEHVLAETVYIP